MCKRLFFKAKYAFFLVPAPWLAFPINNFNYYREYEIHKWHPLAMLNDLRDPDFSTFIGNIISRRPGFASELFGWYTLPGINFIGKQESLEEDLIHVLKIMNLYFDEQKVRRIKKINVSPNNIEISWNPTLRDEMLSLEKVSLVRYKYE